MLEEDAVESLIEEQLAKHDLPFDSIAELLAFFEAKDEQELVERKLYVLFDEDFCYEPSGVDNSFVIRIGSRGCDFTVPTTLARLLRDIEEWIEQVVEARAEEEAEFGS